MSHPNHTAPLPTPKHFCRWKKKSGYKKQLCSTKEINKINFLDTFFFFTLRTQSASPPIPPTFPSFISLTPTRPRLSIIVRLNCLPLLITKPFGFAHGNFYAQDRLFFPICQNLWFSLLKTQFEAVPPGLLITSHGECVGLPLSAAFMICDGVLVPHIFVCAFLLKYPKLKPQSTVTCLLKNVY